jgi:HD-like signal output (HDOD) protein
MRAVEQRAASAGDLDPDIFLRKLRLQLAVGDVRLPSFPDIAARVQKVLEDPRSAPAKVAVVVRSEAALAARILRLANSSFLNPSGERINDLRIALTRLGVQLVRCTAVSFALQQMQFGGGDTARRSRLHELWREGALVAAIAYVLARETRAANPDEALLTGLMHNIGNLYITLQAPAGMDVQAAGEIHPQLAAAILTHWKFPAAIIAAVGQQNAADPEPRAEPGLSEILKAAAALVPCVGKRDALPAIVAAVPAFSRLELTTDGCNQILVASAEQIRSLRAGLFD